MLIRTEFGNFGCPEDLRRYMQKEVADWIKLKEEESVKDWPKVNKYIFKSSRYADKSYRAGNFNNLLDISV